MFIRKYLFALIFLPLSMAYGTGQANDRLLHFTSIENSPMSSMSAEMMTVAWKRAGYDIDITWLPGKRALLESTAGNFDGEISRIGALAKRYPMLKRVAVSHHLMGNYAFVRMADRDVISPAGIRNYTIGLVNGIVANKRFTEGMTRTFLNDVDHLFIMLEKRRVDVAMTSGLTGRISILQNFSADDFFMYPEPLVQNPLYHYLHERKAYLLPVINAELEKMKRAGEFDTIREDFIRRQAVKPNS